MKPKALLIGLLVLFVETTGGNCVQPEPSTPVYLGDSRVFTGDSFERASTEHGRLRMDVPVEYVQGFPMLAFLTVEPTDESINVIPFDLAYATACGVELSFVFQAESKERIQVGWHWLGTPSDELHWPSPVRIGGDQPLSWLVDLSQLLLPQTIGDGRWSRLPGTGEWTMTAVVGQFPLVSNQKTVTVRSPTEAEAEFLESMAIDGAGKSWFPTIVTSQKPIPDMSHLPDNTRQIGRLIEFLRAAVQSNAAGLVTVRDAEGDWGYLQRFMEAVGCECIAEAGYPHDHDGQDLLKHYKIDTRPDFDCGAMSVSDGLIERFRKTGIGATDER